MPNQIPEQIARDKIQMVTGSGKTFTSTLCNPLSNRFEAFREQLQMLICKFEILIDLS